MNNYWELILHDGTRLEIPPKGVEAIKRSMDTGRPIHTAHSGSIPANQIKTFRPTPKPYSDQPLLEDVARAFKEPIIETRNGEDFVQARWVKKMVTQRQWDSHYSSHSHYQNIGMEDGMIKVAFAVPTHLIDLTATPYLTDEEYAKVRKG